MAPLRPRVAREAMAAGMSPPASVLIRRGHLPALVAACVASFVSWSARGHARTDKSPPLQKANAMTQPQATPPAGEIAHKEAIRPFHVSFPDKALADLRRRILDTQWPEKETVPDQS